MAIRDFFEAQGYRNLEKRTIIAISVLVIAVIILGLYFLFFYTKPCLDSQCFIDAMAKCKKVTWIKEDTKASWIYTIIGKGEGQSCDVNVELANIKQGPAENEKLIGKSMICNLRKGSTDFPEGDLLRCSGVLKEQMQEMIIQNMHQYILENLGEIKQEFKGI